MDREEKYEIRLNIDRERIYTVLGEAYRSCGDMLGVEFRLTEEEFVSKMKPFLDSNRVTKVELALPSDQYPEMLIEVDVKRPSVFARMANKSKQAFVNRILKNL